MDGIVTDIIAQIPIWAEAKDVQLKPFGGLTNTNYLVTVNGEQFVLRVSGQNSARLGINREWEYEALRAASAAGIGPEVVVFLPGGHLVTRLIEGRHWTGEEYRTAENLQRMVQVLKRLHALPEIRGRFSPFQRVAAYADQASALAVPFPEDFAVFLKEMLAIEVQQRLDSSAWRCFCHNDLFSVNFLDAGESIRIVDWEFAGMGDIYFDLAALVYAYDSEGPLSAEHEAYLLESYFGAVSPARRRRLAGMKFMLLFFTAMWGLLQHGLQRAGIIPSPAGFDCLAYAQETFAGMRAGLPWE